MKQIAVIHLLRCRTAAFVAAAMLTTGTVWAQATGSLSGRVSDAATGKSLQGAVVRVIGTTASAYTDANGRFTLPGVPAGTQRVEIDYVGLDHQEREVNITAGGAQLDAALESKA